MKHTLSRQILAEFSQFVADKLGLHFPQEKWIDLERAVKEIAQLHHIDDPISCINWIMHSLPYTLQIEILANFLTIGETYFFREKACFEVLKNYIFPELIAKRRHSKTMRIWSAPCSTGEEPYTIAMMLTMIIPNINEWNITILASDINETALHRMKEGIYTEWSFRESPAGIKAQFFTKAQNNRYIIIPKIKKMITPLHLNLSQDCFPDILNGTNAMDLILCRNMLMYFVEEHRTQVITQFYNSLVNGGHLVVGVSEAALVQNNNFTMVNYPGAIFYKKDPVEALAKAQPNISCYPIQTPDFTEPLSSKPSVAKEIKFTKKTQIKNNLPIKEDSPKPVSDPEIVGQQFRHLANQGKLKEALDFMDQTIKVDRFNAFYYFYRALLHLELGQVDKAISGCKNAIYLNPDFVLPYFILGNISHQHGKKKETKKYYEIVLNLLHHYSDDDNLPGSEGLSSQRMKEIIQSIQRD